MTRRDVGLVREGQLTKVPGTAPVGSAAAPRAPLAPDCVSVRAPCPHYGDEMRTHILAGKRGTALPQRVQTCVARKLSRGGRVK